MIYFYVFYTVAFTLICSVFDDENRIREIRDDNSDLYNIKDPNYRTYNL